MGDFNVWDANSNQMQLLGNTGIWELKVAGAQQWDRYKYRVVGADSRIYEKGDPFARHFETRPNNASILYDPDDYLWNDDEFCDNRTDALTPKPINIYELHLGSWEDIRMAIFSHTGNWLSICLTIAKKMNYTHIELMPVLEHPLDDSWGYQVTGYYAVTSRFGTPADFKFMVDVLHQNGISVILDWVPAHFLRISKALSDLTVHHVSNMPTRESENTVNGEHMSLITQRMKSYRSWCQMQCSG